MKRQEIFNPVSVALRDHKPTFSDVRVERHSETGPTVFNPPSNRGGMHGLNNQRRFPRIEEARVELEFQTFPAQAEVPASHAGTQAGFGSAVKNLDHELAKTGADGTHAWRNQGDGFFDE
jgi:hypothetical protein